MSTETPLRVLFVCTAHKTHFYPLVPMAWALRTAGHEVRVATPPELTGTVTGTGLTAVPVGVADWDDPGDPAAAEMSWELVVNGGSDHVQNFAWQDPAAWTRESLLALESIMIPTFYDSMNNPAMLDGLVEYARHWRPDLVIRETFTWAGGIVARVAGAADARLVSGPDHLTRARREFLRRTAEQRPERRDDPTAEWLDRTLRRYGCRFDEEVLTGHWTISPIPPSTRLDVGTRVVGTRYIPFNGPSTMPGWLREPAERRRICVTGGLAAQEQGEAIFSMGDVLDALADLDVEVVATLGAGERERLTAVPDNARVVEFVPFHELLPTCAAVVHHGGGGTRATAEFHGVPQVIAAYGWDTVVKAQRMQELRAGLYVPIAAATPEVLRECVVRVLGEPSFVEGARRLRDELLAEPAPNDIVPLLEELTAEYRTRPA
ncbi:activator-dependent family glycosyltransferase [Amycolatopsis sp. NPDC059027]|uniref:activator-dependent family glycosyltransferase n=1 Tax=Amycolatopsis sp. NPDC059027 TaxID=3346709 RepID=UPI00366A5816